MPSLPRWDTATLILVTLCFAVGGVLAAWLALRRRSKSSGQRQERRGTFALQLAAVAATVCTAYSADTSWRFAAHSLGMDSMAERMAMFAAGELALFSTALLARQNLHSDKRAPGLPGILVWIFTAVQVIPAYSESSGLGGGTVRAVLGPIAAALLWHLAMGIELRHRNAKAASSSLAARIGRDVRERLLSRLGIADRSRGAQEIARERAIVRSVALAARLDAKPEAYRTTWRGRLAMRRLSRAIDQAQVATDPRQRERFLARFAARRNVAALLDADLAFHWETGARQPAASGQLRLPTSGDSASGMAPRSHDHPHPGHEAVAEVPTPRAKPATATALAATRERTESAPIPTTSQRPAAGSEAGKRPGPKPSMSDEQVLALARDLAAEEGWITRAPLKAAVKAQGGKLGNDRADKIVHEVQAEIETRHDGNADAAE
ncbi:hypothetical protein [Streptomyces lasiicapitis]|uniref:hypothetical protein n=1 Tax=Streptomyces lasiicapitis TaxID=1923961 RepID=UPI003681F67A